MQLIPEDLSPKQHSTSSLPPVPKLWKYEYGKVINRNYYLVHFQYSLDTN